MVKKKVITYKGAVTTWECDSNQHMNVMYYINKYELAGRNMFVEIGLIKPFMQKNNYGVVVVEQIIKYKQEVFEDDVIYIESTVEGFSNKVITFEHTLKDGITHKILGSMLIKLVILDKTKRKAVPIPDSMIEKLKDFL